MKIKEGGVMDIQSDKDFEKSWQENRHIWESTKNLAKAMFYAGQAKAQAVPEGFVLVSAEQMSQWGHMANYAEQYGCPECFEARGYAHSLACEINEFFAIEPQEPAND